MAQTANTALRDLLLRRAVQRYRMETGCVRDVLAAWRPVAKEIVRHVRATFPPRPDERRVLGMPFADRLQTAQGVLQRAGELIQATQGVMLR